VNENELKEFGTTKVQIKLSRAAIERLIGDDATLETVIGHQAIQTIMERHGERLLQQVTKQLADGLDLKGHYIAGTILGDKVREVIRTEVGNYLRCEATVVQKMVREEVDRQLPDLLRTQVKAALKKAAEIICNGNVIA